MMSGIKKKISVMLFLYALFFSADTLASSITPGKVEMSGELIETACGIDPLSREIWVDFGDVSARDINMDSESHLTKDFNVHLTGCRVIKNKTAADDSFPYATITFIGNSAPHDPSALLVTGEGEGFGIHLRNQHGSMLTIGQPSPGYDLSNGSNILRFTASLVPVNKHIKAGEFYAIARFFIDYN